MKMKRFMQRRVREVFEIRTLIAAAAAAGGKGACSFILLIFLFLQ